MAIQLDEQTLDEARSFFEDRGSVGCEGTALIAVKGSGRTRLVIPEQLAMPYPYCSVEVTDQGKHQLAAGLGLDERFAARIHSHPGEAFHSLVDSRNPALRFEGALSIVVPYFGLGLRSGLNACAVFHMVDSQWHELEAGQHRDDVVRVRD